MRNEISRRPSLRTTLTKREFEESIIRAGGSKRDAMRAVATLQPSTMRALLPLWRRMRITWRARHG